MNLKLGDIVSSGNVTGRLFVVVSEPYMTGGQGTIPGQVHRKVKLRMVQGKNDDVLGKIQVADFALAKLKKEQGKWVGDLSMKGRGYIEWTDEKEMV